MTSTRTNRRLDYAERWFHDGLAVCRPPAFQESIEVDMTRARQLLAAGKERALRLTYTHLFVRAAALALGAHPDLHAMICGSTVHNSGRVDIALSVNAESALAPVMIIEGADNKPVTTIAEEIAERIPKIRQDHAKMVRILRRWGWLVPFGFLRRRLLLTLYRSFDFRRKGCGTFQVSTAPGVDSFSTPLFNATGILTAGRVRDRVISVDGKPAVRPTVILTCSADHRLWNGAFCQRFLLEVQSVLETGHLETEIDVVEAVTSRAVD